MARHAKVLGTADVCRLLEQVACHRYATRNRVIVLLSSKAGLRAAEIAGLDWRMIVGPNGRIGAHLHIASSIAKNESGRMIPLNPDLRRALDRLHASDQRPNRGPMIRSERDGHLTPRSVVNWFAELYRNVGYDGCSSHSGRRTFITRSARVLAKTGGSLRDIQELAGHRALTTTKTYIEGDRDAQRRLVRLI